VANAVKILSKKIASFDDKSVGDLIKYALLYPPRVRALLGAMLQNIDKNINTEKLTESLNPITTFELGLKENDLPTIKNWFIV
jgi:hypothetical protein